MTESSLKLLRFVALGLVCTAPALGQTAQFLDAPTVKSNLEVTWNPVSKSIQWDADGGGTFRSFHSDEVFLTSRSFFITYPQLNPLKFQAAVNITPTDDPGFKAVTNGIGSLLSLAAELSPEAAAAKKSGGAGAGVLPPSCTTDNELRTLQLALTPDSTTPDAVATDIKGWSDAIDKAYADPTVSGAQAIGKGTDELEKSIKTFQDAKTTADNAVKAVKECASSSPDPNMRAIYMAASLTDFSARLNRLGSLISGAKDTKNTLTTNFADPNRWNHRSPRDYIVGKEVEPTFSTMQAVKVTVNTMTISSDDVTGAINISSKEAGSTTFSVRKYARLTPEPGFGAVFGFIERPIYGTSTNASGQIVVAKKSTDKTTLAPTATVNFVCRCSLGLISPMFQLGASITKDLPALLVGGGIRLFGLGKGDVALGGGAMFGWYKDLKTLTVGSPIKGTTDIDNDLTYISAPKTSGYLTIQYKFSL